MKKTKFLAIIMVLALSLMGVGYALWSDSVTLVTTVKTGEFDVQFCNDSNSCNVSYPPSNDYPGAPNADPVALQSGFTFNGDGDGDGTMDKAMITLSNLYPGCTGTMYLRIGNYGTIPARLKGIRVTAALDNGTDFSSYFKVKANYKINPAASYTTLIGDWTVANGLVLADPGQAVVLDANNSTTTDLLGESLYAEIPFLVDPSLTTAELSQITVTTVFDWEQWANPSGITP